MTQIIIVRHGESQGNKSGLICGWHDCELTEFGKEQAKQTSVALKGTKIDCFISSDLIRARQTAQIISNEIGTPFIENPELRERNCGILDGIPVEQALAHPKWDEFMQNPNGRIEGCETTQELYDRASNFICEIVQKHENKTIMLSTHGGILWVLVPFVLGISLQNYRGLIGMDNCGLTIISHSKGVYALQSLNITTHLGRHICSKPSWEF